MKKVKVKEADVKMDTKVDVNELAELGLTTAAENVGNVLAFEKKIAIAYEHFRYVKPEKFVTFNDRLKKETTRVHEACPKCHNNSMLKKVCGYCQRTGAQRMTYDQLKFIPLGKYSEVPPRAVLNKLKEAQQKQCFDYYEVAKIHSVEELPDPIIFGCIESCPDKFYIAQWDNDVKIEQILKENEG